MKSVPTIGKKSNSVKAVKTSPPTFKNKKLAKGTQVKTKASLLKVQAVIMSSAPKRAKKSESPKSKGKEVSTLKAKKEKSPEKSQSDIVIPKVVPKKPCHAYLMFAIE